MAMQDRYGWKERIHGVLKFFNLIGTIVLLNAMAIGKTKY